MKILGLGRYALYSCVAAAMLVGCGGSQPPIGAPGGIPQSRAIAAHSDRGGSWMAPERKKSDLLYIADVGTSDVYVYSYPNGTLMGTLTGFDQPHGECVDHAGDVFITNGADDNIVEYAHGGTSPIATLSDTGYFPFGCSVDPTTGDLAVTNIERNGSRPGDVVIYKHAKGSPSGNYTDSKINYMYFCGYDNLGNLFVDGMNAGTASFGFAELHSGGSSLKNIKLNEIIGLAGGVQWESTSIAVGDENAGSIYQFTIHGHKGTEVSYTQFQDTDGIGEFWIQGGNVVAPDFGYHEVQFFKYPAGGSATKVITGGLSAPFGATISKAK